MNRIHRLVWNACAGTWVAAAENARSRGKQGAVVRRSRTALLTASMGLCTGLALAGPPAPTSVVPANGSTQAYTSANGVPVVNIATANASGLSHNLFTQYNVDSVGLVLNNANSSQMANQSQLAGQVAANLNLNQQARVILNEVVSTNRSTLAGFTEVLGGKADVIVANPYGITCLGCGFINTDRVTLTTGRAALGGDGSLTGFSVNGGDVLVDGTGLNASAQQVLDIVARAIKIKGNINTDPAGSLGLFAGISNWTYANRTATASGAVGADAAPAYAVDSSALGGMYAGRIRIIATEAGVGVRMLGSAAASADDFTLSSAGKIELMGKTSAARDLALSTSSASGSGDLSLSAAELSAGRNLSLLSAGETRLSDGVLYAANNLDSSSVALVDASSSSTASRFAQGTASIQTSGAAQIDGSNWGAASALQASVGSLAIGPQGATLHSDGSLALQASGDLALGTAAMQSVGDMALGSASGSVSTAAGAQQGVQSTMGAITISAGNGLNNAGTISADAGALDLRVNGGLVNSGTLHAVSLSLADRNNAGTETINNTGTLLSEGALSLQAAALTNSGTVQSGTASTITADTLTNSGMLQSLGSAALNITTSLTNSGQLLSTGDMTLRGTDAAYTVSNSARMQAGGLLDIKGQGAGSGVSVTVGSAGVLLGSSMDVKAGTLTLNNGAKVSTTGAMNLSLATLAMGGSSTAVVAATSGTGNATISTTTALSNPGVLHSGDILSISAPSITNTSTGGISALHTLTLNATAGNLVNSGALYAGNQLNATASGTMTNTSGTGTMDSDGSMALEATTFVNNNTIRAVGTVGVKATTFRNEVPGGDTRTDAAPTTRLRTETGHDSQGYNGHGCCDQYESWYYQETWSVSQFYAGGKPGITPQITAQNITIQNFANGYNLGGLLSATGTLTLQGGPFTNDALALTRTDYIRTWEEETKYIAAGGATYYERRVKNDTTTNTSTQIDSIAAGVRAGSLSGSTGSLTNLGSPFKSATSSRTASGTNATTIQGASFPGLVLTLPTNPNGFFIVSPNPGSKYLVETNPLYAVGSSFVGSDYMLLQYGYDPETTQKRLGDASYEAYLIRQQLISQTGTNLLAGAADEAEQMKKLMDQAVAEGKSAGFEVGRALTPAQIANLKTDVVWMVETTVAGQKVLAPVVYLSAATRAAVTSGAVISATNVDLKVDSLTNTGGTISGSDSLKVTSKGDITNTSGTISGGDVTLQSTEGSIKNQTLTQGSGSDTRYTTTIGKEAGITATGNLNLDAAKDITVTGAKVQAGGDASLSAGGEIRFDTIVDKTTTSTSKTSGSGLQSSTEKTTTTTETNIGSSLQTGGNLKLKSGGDTVIGGSTATVGGNLDVDTGGSFKVEARQDKVTTSSQKTTSGLGVGGGVVGTEDTVTNQFKGTNAASTLTVGGNATIKAGKEMTIQGSDVTIGGNADIQATQGINVLDGLDEERTTTRTTTTTFLKMDNGGSSGSGTSTQAQAGTRNTTADASASADANANASGNSSLKLSESTQSTTQSGSTRSVASNLTVGGNLTAKTDGTLKVQGSNVSAGGDMVLEANNVEVLTGRNTEYSNTQTTRESVGLYSEGSATADANASGQAKAGSKGTDASAGASVGSQVGGTSTLGAQLENEQSSYSKVTNTSSSLKSGGSMAIKAKDTASFVGAQVESGGDMAIEAKNIVNKAAQDTETSSSSKTTQTMGLYVDASASAEASAGGEVGKLNTSGAPAEAAGGADANAGVSAGLQYKTQSEGSSSGSVTQVTSGFKSGGNLTRKATDTIVDQGTQLEAAGNINQSAREIKEIEANNSSYSTQTSSSHDAKVGVGAGASAGASADSSGSTETEATAGAGARAKYVGGTSSDSESSTTAVTTRYKAGGAINSTSTEKTTLIGTQMEAGGDVNINAGSLDYQAARDTTTASSSSTSVNVDAKVDVVGKVGGSVSAGYEGSNGKDSSSTARAGGISSGGNVKINTSGDTKLEGTTVDAAGGASITAGGSVDMKAARSTSESSSTAVEASLEVSAGKGSKSVGVGAGFQQDDASSDTAQGGSIKAGSGGISITAGKNVALEGASLQTQGDTALKAGGTVDLKAAKSTQTETSYGASVELGSSKEGKEKTSSGALAGNASLDLGISSDTTSIQSGGKVTIQGAKVVNQEADIQSGSGTQITGKQVNTKAENLNLSVGIELNGSAESTK